MKRFGYLLVCLLAVSLAVAQPPSHLFVRVNVPSGLPLQMLPVLATADLADVQAVFGATPPSGMIVGIEDIGGTKRAVLGQMDVGSIVRVALLLPSEPSGQRLIRLQPGTPTGVPGPPPLRITRDGNAVTITNGTYEITHDPSQNGGLPSKIVFPQTGKIWDNFSFNDRLYSKQEGVGGFRLGDDNTPELKVLAAGPLYAEVQVRARYLQDQEAPPGNAQAVYTYSYFAGLPTIRITGDISQNESSNWDELHFFELHFKDDAFTHWAASNVPLTPFKDDSKGSGRVPWAALIEGKNAVAFLGSAMIYDGKTDYGRYLHGPWVGWSDTTTHFAADVWIAAPDDPVAAIAQAAAGSPRIASGTVLTPGLLDALAALRRAGGKDTRLPWVASLIEKDLADGKLRLLKAEELAKSFLTKGLGDAAQRLMLGSPLRLLSTSELGLALREDHGLELVSLYDLQRQRETLAAPCSLIGVAMSQGTRIASLTNDSFTKTSVLGGNRQSMELQWEEPRDIALRGLKVNLTVRLDGALSYWTTGVTNGTAGWSIDRVTLPSLKIAALGDDAGDDVMLFPNGFGRAYPVTSGTIMGGHYPSGGAVMQWIGVCDSESGIYVGHHDPTAGTKTLYTTCGGDGAYSTMRIEVPAENASLPGNSYQTQGQVVIGVTGGGWWPMTRHYRQWLDKSAPWWPEPGKISRGDYPQWIQDIQTWALWGAGHAKDTVPPTRTFAEAMGVPTALHWYNWHVIPFDDDYPHYFPTKEGFREGVKELQQMGVRVMPYINGRLWDTDTESFISEAHKYATKRPDGEPYTEEYGSKQKLAPMCVHTKYWQDKIQEIVLKLVAEEGVDGVYIDQIGAAGAVLCYDKTHGHPLAGGHWWVDGYWKMLGELQQKIAQVHPDKMLTTESNAEPYAKYLDAYLMCNSNSDYEVPLFPAVYGGKILMFGTYANDADWQDLTLMALRQGKLFTFGSQLWWSNPNIVKNEPATKWLHDLAHLRQRLNQFFVHGQMAAPPVFAEKIGVLQTDWAAWGPNKIRIHTPDLWATAWRVSEGPANSRPVLMMPLVNLPKQERTFTLQFDPAAYGLKANARVKIERMSAAGVTETVTKQGRFALPIKLGPAEATALVIRPQ